MTLSPSDPVARMLAEAAEQDETIKKAVRKLAFESILEAHNLLSAGSPATRLSVIRSLLPALVRSLEKTDEHDNTRELQKQLSDLMEEMRTGAKVVLDVSSVDDTKRDQPIRPSQPAHPKKLTGGS